MCKAKTFELCCLTSRAQSQVFTGDSLRVPKVYWNQELKRNVTFCKISMAVKYVNDGKSSLLFCFFNKARILESSKCVQNCRM